MNKLLCTFRRVWNFFLGTYKRAFYTLIGIIILACVQQIRPGLLQGALNDLWRETSEIIGIFMTIGIIFIGIGVILKGLFKGGKK